VELDGNMLFDRSVEGRFPEVKEIKQKIRDIIAPDMNLGHSDGEKRKKASESNDEDDDDDLDENEASEARKYFGVM
jgi:selenoprotein W-related protein